MYLYSLQIKGDSPKKKKYGQHLVNASSSFVLFLLLTGEITPIHLKYLIIQCFISSRYTCVSCFEYMLQLMLLMLEHPVCSPACS
jgi:hypothetical protein